MALTLCTDPDYVRGLDGVCSVERDANFAGAETGAVGGRRVRYAPVPPLSAIPCRAEQGSVRTVDGPGGPVSYQTWTMLFGATGSEELGPLSLDGSHQVVWTGRDGNRHVGKVLGSSNPERGFAGSDVHHVSCVLTEFLPGSFPSV